ncbi:MAG: Cytoskeleton protein RodZ [Candidatus Erwinia impunctatus]|nr:Cytoskeleton protein RodZ [Culicoides impunctatus]
MNIAATQENMALLSTGQRLREAREQKGHTQQEIAERLCLKLSTIRDLEADSLPADLAATFLRGYVRSYARIVGVPESELLSDLARQAPIRTSKIEVMQTVALGKKRKKRDGWFAVFSWLVVFVVIGLTGAWWWQNHKAAQDDLQTMAEQNADVGSGARQSISLVDHNQPSVTSHSSSSVAPPASTAPEAAATAEPSPAAVVLPATTPAVNTLNPGGAVSPSLPVAPAGVSVVAEQHELQMVFSDNCWIEVTDAKGKILANGIQRRGDKLTLNGSVPYHLKIGAPAAVQVTYQGKGIDLAQFVRARQVARLSVGTQ